MSGSRTKTGCWTCRIRKKKCDEEYPFCGTCRSRDIHCYGYGAPPSFMEGKNSRDEILRTKEALQIRSRAEEVYKARRRMGMAKKKSKLMETNKTEAPVFSNIFGESEVLFGEQNREWYPQLQDDTTLVYPSPQSSGTYETSDTVILRPKLKPISVTPNKSLPLDSIWWDSTLSTSFANPKTSKNDLRLVMIFLDVIFPLQFGFYQLPTSTDRSWLLSSVLSFQPYYHATLGISSCLASGQSQNSPLGVTTHVRELQTIALQGLQKNVDDLGTENFTPKELLRRCTETLSTMNQLLSLEVFSVLGGYWEIHLQAARTLLGMIEAKSSTKGFIEDGSELRESSIQKALRDSSSTYDQKALELQITCFVWIDILAKATYGLGPRIGPEFDYLPLLRNGTLKPEKVMGCEAWVMLIIAEITVLEDWKRTQLRNHSLSTLETATRASHLANRLAAGIKILDQVSMLDSTSLKADSGSVTLIFVYAALIYLHTVVSGAYPAVPDIAHCVTRCLEKIEILPSRLTIRVCWPYVITGCMANEAQYDALREVVARTTKDGQPLGLTWKALMVMEECWLLRARHAQEGKAWGLREAVESMKEKVLLV